MLTGTTLVACVPHVGLGVVETERLDPDEDLARGRDRIGQFGDGQYFRAAVGGDDDGFHAMTLS